MDQDWCYLTFPKSPLDFYLPKVVHTSPTGLFDRRGQSETFTTWRGLSSEGAEELFTWTNIYHAVIEQHTECVSLVSIVDEMVKQYERRPPMGLNWFLSAPNIYQRIERFLSISMATPGLRTEELEAPVVGQAYTLAPTLVGFSDNLSDDLAREVVFSTSEGWLVFDESCNVLSGIVPIAPPRTITVKAKIIEYLDERVRLEHVVRTRVDLKVRAAICAEKYLTKIFNDPPSDRKIVNENAKFRKQVSFADEHETASLHSSPDHLRSFFNELSAMTFDPTHESTKGHTLRAQPLHNATLQAPGSVASLSAIPEVKAAMEICKENGLGSPSQDPTLTVTASPRLRRFESADYLGQLLSDLGQVRSGQTALVGEQAILRPANGNDFPSVRVADSNTRHNCTRDASCAGHHKNGSPQDKSFSLYDADTNLDFELALGLSNPGHEALNDVSEPYRSTPLVFENRFDSLSRFSNMDRPTRACDSLPVSEVESQPDHCEVPDHQVFEHTDKSEGLRKFENVLNGLDQWNWKGWEREIGVGRRSCNKISIPGPSRGNSKAVHSEIEGGLGRQLADRGVPQNDFSDDTKNDGVTLRDQSLNLHECLTFPTLSATTIIKGSRNSSEGSWSMADQVPIFVKAKNSIDRSATLYDTVRNQFYKDHKTRQTSSPRRCKSSSGRGTLSSVFPSISDQRDLTRIDRDDAEEKIPACSPRARNTDGAGSGFLVDETPTSPPSLATSEERKPDIASIAAAVKKSLAAEVLDEDGREKVEIRKGILHHQVMDLGRIEQRRNLGSSNYDDIFWSSDGMSADD
jgi:hypothetical protein